MSIQSETRDGILTIKIRYPRLIEESILEELERDVLAKIDQSDAERVILDFDQVQFMSSAMLGKLVKIHKKCKSFKVKLKLSSVSADIVEVFKITKLNKLFDIEKDEAHARKAFAKRGLFG